MNGKAARGKCPPARPYAFARLFLRDLGQAVVQMAGHLMVLLQKAQLRLLRGTDVAAVLAAVAERAPRRRRETVGPAPRLRFSARTDKIRAPEKGCAAVFPHT